MDFPLGFDQKSGSLPTFRRSPEQTGSHSYFFLAGTDCFAAAACCFFWFEVLLFDCFCAAFLLTDFGDLSPMVFGGFVLKCRAPQRMVRSDPA
jgi:hypothetical protein